MTENINNIVVAGLGGQGVLKASDIIATTAFESGYDVKKAEVHGMSQRGGSVSSDIRFGKEVFSPMVPDAETDFLLVLTEDQIEPNRHRLREGGMLISASMIDESNLENRRSLNVAMIGILSKHLNIDKSHWIKAIKKNLPEKLHEVNMRAFEQGRKVCSRDK